MTETQGGAWLGFSLKGQRYAVSLASVREVIRPGDITPVPGSPDDVLGIVNLRGQIVPVLDGRRRFGLDAAIEVGAAESQRVIVFDDSGSVVGMRIDVIGDMLTFAADEVAPPPPGRAERRDDPVSGVITRDDGFIALVDVARLCRA
ncbi:purine-binding chemotaxis protein CheW [Luteibacter sp. UNC138MFCol5.1]|uniref:chemotaxis protein CheW n=1 Tax=Luteibacter sp. UNC138MFCol5.1 TaxID=1502774 RepID=UPI0008ADDD60|nr:chemotaxis protein CheW [Luteibacter sp. UNC138MFCol5.1]SEO66257.1 purine-binding chemotaxis protein CheW [Luteibacter sp. UNC138MFCol5.1]